MLRAKQTDFVQKKNVHVPLKLKRRVFRDLEMRDFSDPSDLIHFFRKGKFVFKSYFFLLYLSLDYHS